MMPLAYRPFVDPLDLFAGPGWLLFLPPLIFAAALVYHALRCEGDVAWAQLLRKAGWLALRVLLVFGALMAVLWAT